MEIVLVWLSTALMAVLTLLKFLATLPYQRLYIYNTVRPAQEIEEVANLDTEVAENRKAQLVAIAAWRTGKRDELSFMAVAAAVMTAIITGSFSWDIVKTSHWTGPTIAAVALHPEEEGFGRG
ncbi:hypothetical protein NEUTE2DRAFT_116509 [Neurospora tetrasperma FGSC 2509]|nr:hypothetical protein NEUTE2DRAFT_116509 [Neurospora tetrasperma FGSC 2509]